MIIKVMTINIQHGLDYRKKNVVDLRLMADTITACGGEIVGLNEVFSDDGVRFGEQAKEIAEHLGFYFYFAKAVTLSNDSDYGNAIVSKFPIISAETVAIPDPKLKNEGGYYETRCVLKAVIDVMGEPLTVLVSHFGLNKSEAVNAVNTVCEIVEKSDGEKIVLMGDFNNTPDSETLKPIFELLHDTVEEMEDNILTFPTDNPNRKIDYIFVSDNLKVISAEVPDVVAADHRPVIALLETSDVIS